METDLQRGRRPGMTNQNRRHQIKIGLIQPPPSRARAICAAGAGIGMGLFAMAGIIVFIVSLFAM